MNAPFNPLPQFFGPPWKRGEGQFGSRIYSADGLAVCEVWSRNGALATTQRRATAQLIEAAPDLYKAVDGLLDIVSDLEMGGVKLSPEQLTKVRHAEASFKRAVGE